MTRVPIAGAAALLFAPALAWAQQAAPPGRTLQLSDLHNAARAADPRRATTGLLETQSDLRLRNVAAQRLPTISVEGQAQAQSDVATAPFRLANGEPAFTAPKHTYDLYLRVDERLFDATIGAQAAVERAQRAELQARVQSALFTLRQQVNDAFFAAAALEQRRGALRAAIDDLTARLRETAARVEQGAALAADAMTVEATLLLRQQDEAEIAAGRRAALAVLQRLTGQPIGDGDTLALPDLAAAAAAARASAGASETTARPEHTEFARTRDRLARQQELTAAQERPQLVAFGRVGYGKPGLNFISDGSDTYAVGGVQLRWRAWTWNTGARERAALTLQQRIVSAEQEAFTRQVGRATEHDAAAIDRLEAAIAVDDRIVTLREQVLRTADTRFRESVITSAEYLDRSTELLQARFARAAHQVELAQARARLLTTLGMEVR